MIRKNLLVCWICLIAPSVFAGPLTLKDGKVTFLAKGNPGFLSIDGSGGEAEGRLTKEGQSITGEIRCQMNKFSVPIGLRDSHLKENYLKVKEYPESILTLTSFEVDASGTAKKKPFKGKMKLRNIEKPVEGVASLDKDGKLTADLSISLKEFGFEPIKYASVRILDEVAIQVTSTLVEEKGDKAAVPAPVAAPAKK